jgi:hypothetical protein
MHGCNAVESRTNGLETAYVISGCGNRAERHQYVAFILLALAGVVYFARPDAPDVRKWRPLHIPIELKFGKVQTPEFAAGLDTKYRLLVECERRIEFTRLQCLLGMVDGQRAQTCVTTPETIDIDWTVQHNGQLGASGSSEGFFWR